MDFRVLIVEDDEAVAQTEAAKLRACGLVVQIINDGDRAIPTMKEWAPHVVVLDLKLPGMDGLQIAQQMGLDPSLKDIILISNSADMDANQSLGLAYYAYFTYTRKQDPIMVNKLSGNKDLSNDLTAVVGMMIGDKYQVVPQAMREYLEKSKKK